MDRSGFFYSSFLRFFPYEPTSCQTAMLQTVADFLTSDDGDILVVNGYAGTGKTTAVAAVVSALASLELSTVLLAPTGRSAKVLSQYAGRPASTIHKHIYRQKSFGADGFGQFSLAPNKARNTLFIVDEVSLIGITSDGGSAFGTGDLLADLVSFVRAGTDCRLLLLGDAAQLPPVGLDASPALSEEYMSVFGGVSFVTLTTVVRQEAGSGILENATMLRELLRSAFQGGELQADALGLKSFPDVVRISGGELLETLSDAYARYGEDEVVVLCRSNKRAGRYNMGIRAQVLYREEQLVRGDKLMVVKNHYLSDFEGSDYIANGDIARLVWIRHFEERYGLHFADACLAFPDYGNQEVELKVLLDTLTSDAPSLGYAESQALYQGVMEDYAHITTKKKRYEAVRSDPFYSALQIKYAHAITGHKAQGGQWPCVFIDNPIWQDVLTEDDIKWLYTAITRAQSQVYLVNFKDSLF
ncbi:MAG: AAA family ATPase [Bacteroidales bacterium]|nr:AAA family ATPase [Bacteroidales bacterium]